MLGASCAQIGHVDLYRCKFDRMTNQPAFERRSRLRFRMKLETEDIAAESKGLLFDQVG